MILFIWIILKNINLNKIDNKKKLSRNICKNNIYNNNKNRNKKMI